MLIERIAKKKRMCLNAGIRCLKVRFLKFDHVCTARVQLEGDRVSMCDSSQIAIC